jgi:glycosyltransferase involved in cell wall biosynthesis
VDQSLARGVAGSRTLCVTLPWALRPADTFVRPHIDRLPARVVTVHGWRLHFGDEPVLSRPRRVAHKLWRIATRGGLEREKTDAYLTVLRRFHVDAVLAEYGDHAIDAVDACRRSQVPLIAHFHGYDASVRSVLDENAAAYRQLFQSASALVAVSRAMQKKLISLGAPAEKVHWNPYGVDCSAFSGADPAQSPPLVLAVGRFVDKKAPQKTIAAFAAARRRCPEARLRMVGDGPLLGECRRLANELGVDEAVEFAGALGHDAVREEMRRARCFVQHSVEAASGDSEGTPVAIIEASATGLPIVSTRHAGIPDVVDEGTTGFLVDEGDVAGMARHLEMLLGDPSLAGELGGAARRRIQTHFAMDDRLARLWRIIESCIEGDPLDARLQAA